MVDIHSHILPGIDDGAKDIEESMKIVDLYLKQGVKRVIATPHFIPSVCRDLDKYLDKVSNAHRELKKKISDAGLDFDVTVGYEVRYFEGIGSNDVIPRLAFGDGKYLLIEFSYGQKITDRMIDDIEDLECNFGIKPVIAHIERYDYPSAIKAFKYFAQSGTALMQVTSAAFENKRKKKEVFRLISDDMVDFLASDAHSADSRPPILALGYEIIAERFGERVVERLKDNARKLYVGAKI